MKFVMIMVTHIPAFAPVITEVNTVTLQITVTRRPVGIKVHVGMMLETNSSAPAHRAIQGNYVKVCRETTIINSNSKQYSSNVNVVWIII